MANEDDNAADEIEILDPDQSVEVNGETIVVREFRYIEGIRLAPAIDPILARLHELMKAEEEPDDQAVHAALTQTDPEQMVQLMAQACDRDPEWVANLRDTDGLRLANAFWRANRHFFVRRLMLMSPELRAAVASAKGVRAESSASLN